MKVKNGFMRRRLGTQEVVVAVGEASRTFSGIIRLNETAAFLWDLVQAADRTEEELVSALLSEYEVTAEKAAADVAAFVAAMRQEGLLDG